VRTHPSSVARSGYQPGPQSVWGSCRHRIPSSVRTHGTSTPPHRTARTPRAIARIADKN
jgi:hypothetical protein